MSELFLGRIYVDVIEPGRLETDKYGRRYAKIAVILLGEPDEHGNDIIIQHRGSKAACNHLIIGNAQYQNPINYDSRRSIIATPLPSKMDYRVETQDTEREY